VIDPQATDHLPTPVLASSRPESETPMKERRLVVIQGGGPTQVFNATLAAIISEARISGTFTEVLGARCGMKGLADGNIVDLSSLSASQLAILRLTPGALLGSSRAKLTEQELSQAANQLRRLKVQDLVLIGGNGTMRGARAFGQYCRDVGSELRLLGAPKTVDNDIAGTDRCPGYASAARYIAQSTCDLGVDVRSLPQPVSILETMGRSVGWLAAASAAGKQDDCSAPHLVYLPERAFVMDRFLADLDSIVTRRGWAVVVVSEGIRTADGALVYQNEDPAQADPLRRPITGGVSQFLADSVARLLRIRCRSEKPGLLGRASMHHVALQDLADAERVGRAAVRGLLAGETDKMVSLLPLTDSRGNGHGLVPLTDVVGVERTIPAAWLSDQAIPATQSFFDYLRPLIGELLSYGPPFLSEPALRGDASL
jgi:ATP-dependent phosphofructokinase / diphosphate-dependent phosphofructokinase